jgi:hypothetical protein
MNLKMGKGKVPIITNYGDYQYLLVDFPTREWFDEAYKRNTIEQRDKYWDILTKRSGGATLEDSGYAYALSRERIRQIEGKFIRKVREKYLKHFKTLEHDLTHIEQMALSSKTIRSFLETETQ